LSSVDLTRLGAAALKQVDAFLSAEREQAVMKANKPSKYRNVKCKLGDMTFDSKAEMARYVQLDLYRRAGHITDLERQVKFPIAVNGMHICTWIADFRYTEVATGEVITEDYKGFKTPVYNLKKKLIRAVYGINIKETK